MFKGTDGDGPLGAVLPQRASMIVPIVIGSTIPGAILGVIVGFATQRFGRPANPSRSREERA